MQEDSPCLRVEGLASGYGNVQVLWGVDLSVAQEERVVLLGTNGAGKTTLLKTLVGLLPTSAGQVEFEGERVEHLRTHQRIRRGMALMSETGILASLSVEENLLLGGYVLGRKATRLRLEPIYALFPELKPRRRVLAGGLSGGQRKMLAFGKALMSDPRLVIMDEPSTGLSPRYVSEMISMLHAIQEEHKMAMLVAEQNVKFLEVARRVYILEGGKIRFDGTVDQLQHNDTLRRAYFGLEGTPVAV